METLARDTESLLVQDTPETEVHSWNRERSRDELLGFIASREAVLTDDDSWEF